MKFNDYAFYAVRGYTLEKLANLSFLERKFLHYARNQFYKEESKKYSELLTAIGNALGGEENSE